MRRYYILTNKNQIECVGEFNSFYDAWDFVDIEEQLNFLWLIDEDDLMRVADDISHKLGLNR